ncbi:MAG: PH domain-containing protein [Candidatus Nanoarchaeia archaeon]|nr:PH domain-containing protein [Candidatus Haiyanarchaeum thermophilum]MCW1303456.1 PH domain-containing protein [Candidatus Haiyanarchaeum thermophilum]MCW1304148.1 PH domain-containing protein [Candidatus Haiyanarchaeum thermophilum]MCW1306892.1 PH domain-containing protein [Candidatus Haiyanarchaeum thermophilum]MCW1308298.1 PH domain-containing protein [Candidatus Haiyanarchaeum thermophilum]
MQPELQKGEKVIREIRPDPSFLLYLLLNFLLANFILLGSISTPVLIASIIGGSSHLFLLFLLLIVLLPLFISAIVAVLHFKRRYYWITNRRVIERGGFLFTYVKSVSLEEIGGIVIDDSGLLRFFGKSNIYLQPREWPIQSQERVFKFLPLNATSLLSIEWVEDPADIKKIIENARKKLI